MEQLKDLQLIESRMTRRKFGKFAIVNYLDSFLNFTSQMKMQFVDSHMGRENTLFERRGENETKIQASKLKVQTHFYIELELFIEFPFIELSRLLQSLSKTFYTFGSRN